MSYYAYLLLIIVLFAIGANATSWWLLGVSPESGQSQSDPINFNCNEVVSPSTLTPVQKYWCNLFKPEIRSIAIGTRNGIVECQQKFKQSLWNCTTFQGSNLFGAFINDDTRETAVVNALLTAGAARRIAEDCSEENLPSCTCITDGRPKRVNGTLTLTDCNFDSDHAKFFMENFLIKQQNTTLVDQHNIRLGINIVQDRYKKCKCHGISGSCSVRTCYQRSPEYDDIGKRIRSQYSVAFKVSTSGGRLQPVDRPGTPISSQTPVYTGDSPSFCFPNATKGIIGTRGRPCRNTPGVVDSCDVLCCQRGANAHVTEVAEECCRFVWCCRIECQVCRRQNVTTYTCK